MSEGFTEKTRKQWGSRSKDSIVCGGKKRELGYSSSWENWDIPHEDEDQWPQRRNK